MRTGGTKSGGKTNGGMVTGGGRGRDSTMEVDGGGGRTKNGSEEDNDNYTFQESLDETLTCRLVKGFYRIYGRGRENVSAA
jgi:hypothetical protein